MVTSPKQDVRIAAYLEQRDDHIKVINFSRGIRDRERRRTYLLSKAQYFMAREEFEFAALICWHILYQVDARSQQAKQLLRASYSRIFRPRHP